MAEEEQTQSIRDRIAAFNSAGTSAHLGRAPITANVPHGKRPDRPLLDQRSQSTSTPANLHIRVECNGIGNEPNVPRRDGILPPPSNITRTGQNVQNQAKPAPPPRLPPRKQSTQASPALPPRRPSDRLSKKASDESISSTMSSISAISNGASVLGASRKASMDNNRIKAPPFDSANLPALPQKRGGEERRSLDVDKSKTLVGLKLEDQRRIPPLQSMKSSPSITTTEVTPEEANTPALPPRRPSESKRPPLPIRKLPPIDRPPVNAQRSALSFGMNKMANGDGMTNGKNEAATTPSTADATTRPSIPVNPRPDISKILATKPKPGQPSASPAACLLCRDFSAVDAHAAKFPREQVPSLDWLAQQLTNPFPSLTDKARSIFAWLHQNISYDVVAFFNGNVKPSTPASTLQTGLAVCEGYAGLFTALASKVGLESVVVGGHGKGFGFASLPPGTSVPPEKPSGHAWNAVKIDHGYWKLLDPCWGAGNVSGKGQPYNKHFSPRMFTMSNVEFGLRHYPQNTSHFFVEADGKYPPTWQEYFLGPLGGAEPLRVYSGVAEAEGISEMSFLPRHHKVPILPSAHAGPTMRFQFSRLCEHWDPLKNGEGKPYVFVLAIGGIDGREKDFVPFEMNGHVWWCDVEPRRLGGAGQTVSAYTVESVDGQSGRGLGIEGYRQAKGRKGMGFGGLCAWQLV